MTTGYIFLFVCIAFACRGAAGMPGDGAYYDTKAECHQAARTYAKQQKISLGRWEIVCTERERPQ